MKRIFVILSLLICLPVISEDNVQTAYQNPLIVPQNIDFKNCTKIYAMSQEKLLYLALASITSNRFNVEEIQTAGGYIIFSANRNKYLMTIAKIDNSNSILKITPCNNVYKFPPGIITNTMKYIDLNINTEIKS